MKVIWDERKQAYLVDIKQWLVSDTYETIVSPNFKDAYKFRNEDLKHLIQFEKLLNYKRGELKFLNVLDGKFRKVDK